MHPTNSVLGLLARAAQMAADEGLDNETFMSAAWKAVLDAHPGMREALADKELRKQLRTWRKQGLIGQA
jgi:hypothetical protein